MYFLPLGPLISTEPEAVAAAGLTVGRLDRMNVLWVAHNLTAVSLDNIVRGMRDGRAGPLVHPSARPSKRRRTRGCLTAPSGGV